MGISCGRTARVMVSANNNKIAPASMDSGISFRLSGPVINLTMCGTKRPTKPMIPETDTQIAAIMDPVTKRMNVIFFRSTPRLVADLGPSEIRFKSLAKNMDMKSPITRKVKTTIKLDQVFDAKLPISQKIITETCSLAMNFRKLIPAERIEATMIPDKIRLLEESPAIGFLEE